MNDTPQSLPELLSHSAALYGNKRFAVDAATRAGISFAGLDEASSVLAGVLAERFDVKPGQHVAILMPNCLEILPAYFGILRAGCVAVPINARLKSDELHFILGDCEARALFVHPATWKPAQEALRILNRQAPVIAACFDQPPPGTVPFSELVPAAKSQEPRVKSQEPAVTRHDVAAIIYTSGTTGRPKGAMLTHGNILFNIEATKAGHR